MLFQDSLLVALHDVLPQKVNSPMNCVEGFEDFVESILLICYLVDDKNQFLRSIQHSILFALVIWMWNTCGLANHSTCSNIWRRWVYVCTHDSHGKWTQFFNIICLKSKYLVSTNNLVQSSRGEVPFRVAWPCPPRDREISIIHIMFYLTFEPIVASKINP